LKDLFDSYEVENKKRTLKQQNKPTNTIIEHEEESKLCNKCSKDPCKCIDSSIGGGGTGYKSRYGVKR
jgi:hypothetical protein